MSTTNVITQSVLHQFKDLCDSKFATKNELESEVGKLTDQVNTDYESINKKIKLEHGLFVKMNSGLQYEVNQLDQKLKETVLFYRLTNGLLAIVNIIFIIKEFII